MRLRVHCFISFCNVLSYCCCVSLQTTGTMRLDSGDASPVQLNGDDVFLSANDIIEVWTLVKTGIFACYDSGF